MSSIVIREVETFPEPGFTLLQREVFSAVQAESPQVDRMLDTERLIRESIPAHEKTVHAAMVRLGAYAGEELVGWSLGWFERGESFYMANSGVLPRHQRQGVYSHLVAAVLALAKERGAVAIRSQHSVLNNAVIICKLKLGFQVSGLSASAHMGLLVELTQHLSVSRAQLFSSRVIPLVARQHDA